MKYLCGPVSDYVPYNTSNLELEKENIILVEKRKVQAGGFTLNLLGCLKNEKENLVINLSCYIYQFFQKSCRAIFPT